MKVSLFIPDKYIHRFHAMLNAAPILAANGIELSRDDKGGDVLFVQESMIREFPDAVRDIVDRPMIVYERIGCAPVNNRASVRTFMSKKNVLSWAKETSFYDLSMNNLPMIDGRYHLTLINSGPHLQEAKPQSITLSNEILSKIAEIFPIHMQGRYDYLKSLNARTIKKRSIDVFYAGTMSYANKLVDSHRESLVENLTSIKNRNVLIGQGNVFHQDRFHDTIIQSKIFISPYGSGTYSWKDFEAIFAGCVLIKPKADFISHYGFKIYEKNKYCVSCNPDFSDVHEIIESILTNLDHYAAFASDARQAIFDACSLEQYADDLTGYFRSLT